MSTTSNDFAQQGQDWAHKPADKVQASIRDAQQASNEAGEKLSTKVETARSQGAPSIKKVADQTQAVVRQGMQAVNTAAQQVRDTAMHTSDSLVAFTKENPIKTILIAAASGALLLTLFNALARSRD
jgi:ElaB/YqjD/DUF883 family membrane-anchored ribosome-binding protein